MTVEAAPGVHDTGRRAPRLPDLSSLSEEQRSAVAYMAQREAAALIRRALEGADQRIASAIANSTVMIPIFHLEEVAQIEANWSSGKATHVSGEASA